MSEIKISVIKKIPLLCNIDDVIIADNSDYVFSFDFDADWDAYPVKTLKICFSDNTVTEKVFEGDSVTIAQIVTSVPLVASVGVYAGDICTTAVCRIMVIPSVNSLSGNERPQTESNTYDEIMLAVNESVTQSEERYTEILEEKLGQAGGIATLDEDGKLPVEQLPDSITDLVGAYDDSELRESIQNKLNKPSVTGTSGQFLSLGINGETAWSDIDEAYDDTEITQALAEKLDKPSTAGTSGQVLTLNGQGNPVWRDPDANEGQISDLKLFERNYLNMFDLSTATEGKCFYTSGNANTTSNSAYGVSDYIKVESGSGYVLAYARSIKLFNENKGFIKTESFTGNSKKKILEMEENVGYIRFDFDIAKIDIVQVYKFSGDYYEYDSYLNNYYLNPSTQTDNAIAKSSVENFPKNLMNQILPDGAFSVSKTRELKAFHWNAVDPEQIKVGYNVNSSGDLYETGIPSSDSALLNIAFDFCEVTPGETLQSTNYNLFGYDENGAFVSTIIWNSGKYTIPETVYKIRGYKTIYKGDYEESFRFNILRDGYGKAFNYQSVYAYENSFPLFKSEDAYNGFQLYSKILHRGGDLICTIGDSFSATGVWQTKMCDILKTKYYNTAMSGSRFSASEEGSSIKSAYQQAQSLANSGVSPSEILVLLGTNDSGNNISIGDIVISQSISDFDLATFTGGMQACINCLQNNFPDCVIKMGWTPAGGLTNSGVDNYIERMKKICVLYGIEYIETRTCGITTMSAAYNECWEMGASGGHPTTAGQEHIGKYFARILHI